MVRFLTILPVTPLKSALFSYFCISFSQNTSMGIVYHISEKYSQESLAQFVAGLPASFEGKGNVIFSNRRNTIKMYELAGVGTVVVKQYGVRNVFQRLWYGMAGTSKAQKAFRNSLAILQAGVDTPEPMAWAEERTCGIPGACYLVTTRATGRAVAGILEQGGEQMDRLAGETAALVARLHTHGIVHHDGNCTNLLYEEAPGGGLHLSLIDTNRARVREGGSLPPFKEYMEDMVRLTDRFDFMVPMMYHYARIRGLEPQQFVFNAVARKIWHNRHS